MSAIQAKYSKITSTLSLPKMCVLVTAVANMHGF